MNQSDVRAFTRAYQRVEDAERQLAATVDELTEGQTENARLAALVVEAFDQRDAAQAAREQAEAQRDRALEQLAESRAEMEQAKVDAYELGMMHGQAWQ